MEREEEKPTDSKLAHGLLNELPQNIDTEEEIDNFIVDLVSKMPYLPSGVISHIKEYLDQRLQLKRLRDALTEKLKQMKLERLKKANKEIGLPISSKDLTNSTSKEKKSFLRFAIRSVVNMPPKYHGILLFGCGSFLSYQTKNVTTLFGFQFANPTNTQQSLLSFGEAFDAFFQEMVHITMFMLCYFVSFMLVWSLDPGLQIFFMLFLISAPLFYFPQLGLKASGVDVACTSFKMPPIWFTTLGALVLSLVCGALTLLSLYSGWGYAYEGRAEVREIDVSLDGLADILDG